ncbi:hypothetical protein AALB_2499 [Agarivorans albus MKT 106]|uniref:Uncharacterized protein n=1 Tax=Agarivorans albus MKT 106 TaxID=1331007 RepID=R9PM32_AGAAL|nr:hypothetical protein AALB_2499 [Agarivorans albus MKT 106]
MHRVHKLRKQTFLPFFGKKTVDAVGSHQHNTPRSQRKA